MAESDLGGGVGEGVSGGFGGKRTGRRVELSASRNTANLTSNAIDERSFRSHDSRDCLGREHIAPASCQLKKAVC